MIALGLNGAPGMVTLASSDIVETEFNFSLPPIFSMYLLIIVSTVTSEEISLLKIGFSIEGKLIKNRKTSDNKYTDEFKWGLFSKDWNKK